MRDRLHLPGPRRFGQRGQLRRAVTSRRRNVRNCNARFGQVDIDQCIACTTIPLSMRGVVQLNYPEGTHGLAIANDKVDVLLIHGVPQRQRIARERDEITKAHFTRDVACRMGTLQQHRKERVLGFAQKGPRDGKRSLVRMGTKEPDVYPTDKYTNQEDNRDRDIQGDKGAKHVKGPGPKAHNIQKENIDVLQASPPK